MCWLLLYVGKQQHVLVILPVHFKVQVEKNEVGIYTPKVAKIGLNN